MGRDRLRGRPRTTPTGYGAPSSFPWGPRNLYRLIAGWKVLSKDWNGFWGSPVCLLLRHVALLRLSPSLPVTGFIFSDCCRAFCPLPISLPWDEWPTFNSWCVHWSSIRACMSASECVVWSEARNRTKNAVWSLFLLLAATCRFRPTYICMPSSTLAGVHVAGKHTVVNRICTYLS